MGLVIFVGVLTASISGELPCGVDELEDREGVSTFSGSCIGAADPPVGCPGPALAA
jgi:hypothetical protein